ncbi:MAG: hypothetical protein ABI832_01780 [bacterium]
MASTEITILAELSDWAKPAGLARPSEEGREAPRADELSLVFVIGPRARCAAYAASSSSSEALADATTSRAS